MPDTKVLEQNIVAQWQNNVSNGDTRWLDKFYMENKEGFLSWGEKTYQIDREDLTDIYQNAIVVFYENIIYHKIDDLRSSVVTYLYGIGKNMIHKQHRKKTKSMSHEIRLQEHWKFLMSDAEEEVQVMVSKLRAGLDKMKEPCSSILTMFYMRKMNLASIAQSLAYANPDVVKTQKSRCLKQLKQTLIQ